MTWAALVASGPASLAGQQSAPDSAIRAILAQRVASWPRGGIVVALDDRGRSRYFAEGTSNGSGTRALDEQTIFEIGSVTKVFTGTLLAEMVQRGEVSLEDPVAKHLPPSVHVPSRSGREITLLDLATQSSGLPRLPSNLKIVNPANPYAAYTMQDLYDFLSSYTLPRDPGSQYEYTNLGMGLLGVALSHKAATTYEDLVIRRILTPLGMRETRVTLSPAMRSLLSMGHTAGGDTQPPWDLPTLAGAGALRSSARDMLKLIVAFAHPAGTPLEKIAPAATAPLRPTTTPGMQVGLAWHVLERNGQRIVWHNGETGGYHAFVGFIPATGANIVVLANIARSIDDIGLHLLDPTIPVQVPPRPRTEVALDPATLDRFTGEYALAPTFSIVITKENGALWAEPTGQSKVQLFAESPTEFFLRVVDAQFSFVVDSSGAVTGLVLHQNGQNIPGKKVK